MNKLQIFSLLKILFFAFLILACTSSCRQSKSQSKIQQQVSEYYKTYQQRSDFQKFLSFYDENLIFEDIILGEKFNTRTAFEKFFDWDNPNFSKNDTVALIINEQIISNNQVVTQGYFTPFTWGDSTFKAMHFTSILTFNKAGKIQKHIDWINYPGNLVDYNKRKNSNNWIPE